MLGEGWEAIGDGIYRFVGRREAPAISVEQERPTEAPVVEDVSADPTDAEEGDRKRKRKGKQKHLPWR
jgi:hypothetical protein